MIRVGVLGSTGMLGSTLTRVLTQEFGNVIEVNRKGISIMGTNNAVTLDVLTSLDLHKSFKNLKLDYIINAVGKIRQVINEANPEDVASANLINFEFAKKLNHFSLETGIKVIQIGTDCVYSGEEGNYSEFDEFNPIDVYGKTKNLGELASTSSMIIRCSIIGLELTSRASLLAWVLSQPESSKINGFTNHFWNGLTTLHFSKVVLGVIKSDNFAKGVVHLVPRDVVSKCELIRFIAREFERQDLDIQEFEAGKAVDRSLVTINPSRNLQMWRGAGYNRVPSIQEMVSEYANWTQGKSLR